MSQEPPVKQHGLDPFFIDAAKLAADRKSISPIALARYYGISDERARQLIDQLAGHGIVRRCRAEDRTVLLRGEKLERKLADLTADAHELAEQSDGDQSEPAPIAPLSGTGDHAPSVPALIRQEDHPGNVGSAPDTKSNAAAPDNSPQGADSAAQPWADQKPMSTPLPLEQIQTDQDIQCRAEISDDRVNEYAALMNNGTRFPAVVVFRDDQDHHWLADGFHRHRAAAQSGLKQLDAKVYQGPRAWAVLYAAGANALHGLRRTRKDISCAIAKLLENPTWANRSDRWLAEIVGVDHKTIARHRRQQTATGEMPQSKTRTGQDGRERPASKQTPSTEQAPSDDVQKPSERPVNDAGSAPVIAASRSDSTGNPDCGDTPDQHAEHKLADLSAVLTSLDWSLNRLTDSELQAELQQRLGEARAAQVIEHVQALRGLLKSAKHEQRSAA